MRRREVIQCRQSYAGARCSTAGAAGGADAAGVPVDTAVYAVTEAGCVGAGERTQEEPMLE